MKWEKTEKIIFLILAVVALVAAGTYINREKFDYKKLDYKSQDDINYISVSIYGEVVNPGEYKIKEGMRLCDVIYAAGGVTLDADTDKLDLDAVAVDKMTVTVPKVSSIKASDVIPVVNINTADIKTLCLVPGIGEKTAQKIIEYRKENGKFFDVYEITNIDGIGQKTFEGIKEYIITEETQK